MNQCPQYTKEANGLCKIHQYQAEYTPEMMANLTPCSTCRKTFYLSIGKVCDGCKERAIETRKKVKETIILCDKNGCGYKRSTENKYCNVHQAQIFLDDTTAAGLKPCYDHIRGCRSQLPLEYKFSKCQPCLVKDRENDNRRRNGAIAESKAFEGSNKTEKKCTVCCKEYEANVFIGQNGVITKTCVNCRESNRRQDERRDKERRNELARIREQTLSIKYMRFLKDVRQRELDCELTQEQYVELLKQSCYYCGVESVCSQEGVEEDLYKNGIDRKDSKQGYLYDNCVGCCKICNYIKHSLHINIFLKRIEHILTHNHHIKKSLYPEAFCNTKKCDYGSYKSSAIQRKLVFTITREEFYSEIMKDCYICGKKTIENKHKNGLDRFDNSKGYVYENVRSCCGECNVMKYVYSYEDFMSKLKQIYCYRRTKEENKELVIRDSVILEEQETEKQEKVEEEKNEKQETEVVEQEMNCSIVKRENSAKEIRKRNNLRKQKQIAALKEKYGEAVYKEMKAKQMADYRNKKKDKIEENV
jgi:hypothetical protein